MSGIRDFFSSKDSIPFLFGGKSINLIINIGTFSATYLQGVFWKLKQTNSLLLWLYIT